MRAFVPFLILILLTVSATAAEVQELEIKDFRGGMVNSLANSITQDNQAIILENFDIDPVGNLRPRNGYSQIYSDTLTGLKISKLIGHIDKNGRQLLMLRVDTAGFANDTMALMLDVLKLCNDGSSVCTTTVTLGFFQRGATNTFDYSASTTNLNDRTIIASPNSELMFYDGSKAIRSRPLIAKQPEAFVIDSIGVLDGVYTYKYAYLKNSSATADDTSDFSAPTWPVEARSGLIAVKLNGSYASPQDSAIIYRRKNQSGPYKFVAKVGVAGQSAVYYVDNKTDAQLGDSALTLWGLKNGNVAVREQTVITTTKIAAPGAMTVTLDSLGHEGIFGGLNDVCQDATNLRIIYSVVYIDSTGRHSYFAPPDGQEWDCRSGAKIDSAKATLTNIPVPAETYQNITKKLLLRQIFIGTHTCWDGADSALIDRWFIVDTLDVDSTTYTDSATVTNIHTEGRRYCDWQYTDAPSGVTTNPKSGCHGFLMPEWACYDDTVITFRPTDVVERGSRMFAIGSWANRNRVYYSDFGRASAWPFDKFININTRQGDWFVRLLSLEDRLVLFRQNSIVQLLGLSFSNFQVDEIMSGVGLTAPRSLVHLPPTAMFAHYSGIYQLGSDSPVSLPIDASIDSISDLSSSTGAAVDGDYWITGDSVTYIFAQQPIPHWKVYKFTFKDIIPYVVDTAQRDFIGNKYVMVGSDNNLYRLGYSQDTTDAGTDITCRYRSKYFFDGGGREKIVYIDLFGSGPTDTFTINIWADSTLIRKTVKILPNFRDKKGERVIINEICDKASIEIITKRRKFTLEGYTIGWTPWDKGKR